MAGGDRRFGLTADGEAFSAGVLEHLPALLAVGAPGVASYLRLVPSHWAGAYALLGAGEPRGGDADGHRLDRERPSWAANVEVKCFDLLANPYLVLAGLLAAGSAGMAAGAALPEPVDVDPAALGEEALAERGIVRLPTTLREAVDAFAADEVVAGRVRAAAGRLDRRGAGVGAGAVRGRVTGSGRRRDPLGALSRGQRAVSGQGASRSYAAATASTRASATARPHHLHADRQPVGVDRPVGTAVAGQPVRFAGSASAHQSSKNGSTGTPSIAGRRLHVGAERRRAASTASAARRSPSKNSAQRRV